MPISISSFLAFTFLYEKKLYCKDSKLTRDSGVQILVLCVMISTILTECNLCFLLTLLQGMKILHDLGIAISTTSIQRKKKQLVAQQEKRIQKVVTDYVKHVETKSDVEMQRNNFQDMEVEVEVCVEKHAPFEVLGDNLDITITPSKMTMQSQRKSCHWFLLTRITCVLLKWLFTKQKFNQIGCFTDDVSH